MCETGSESKMNKNTQRAHTSAKVGNIISMWENPDYFCIQMVIQISVKI